MTTLNFNKLDGLIPAIIQDVRTEQVLMLGFMNQAAYLKTVETGMVWFYSRGKKRLWMKGETSGNTLSVVAIHPDCDQDTLLILAKPTGDTCHTGSRSCFPKTRPNPLKKLFCTILNRKAHSPEGSYTAHLLQAGLEKLCDKVEEEADEVIFAAKKERTQRLIEESADLIYHLFVLLASKGVPLQALENTLEERQNKSKDYPDG